MLSKIKSDITRKQIAILCVVLFVLLIIGIDNSTSSPKTASQAQSSDSVNITSKSSSPTASPSSNNTKAAALLDANTQKLKDLMAQGKQALGSVQYPDAYTGLAAFDDPASSASKYRDYHKDEVSSCADTPGMTDTSKHVDSYYNGNEPVAVTQWLQDINQASSDLCKWGNDAVSWQISELTTEKLNADEKKFNDDILLAENDIKAVSNTK